MDKILNSPDLANQRFDLWKFISSNQIGLSTLSLVSIAFLVYLPVFSHQFQMEWDDQWVAINVYTENGFKGYNLWAILTEFYHGQYAPINQLSYTLLYSAFGYNPFWFHALGVTLHISNVVLVYFLIRKLLIQTDNFKATSVQRISFVTALIMAVHPFLVEPVAWVAASKILIYSFFYFIALSYYLSYTQSKSLKHFMLVLLFFLLSFGAKEQAVTLPVCALLFDYAVGRSFKSKWLWIEKIPLFLMSFLFGMITLLSQGADSVGLLSEIPQYPFYQNLIFASYSITEYLVKCLVPVKLSYLYIFPNDIGQPVPLRFWMYPVIVVLITTTLWNFWKQRWIFFSISFFIIHLGVALHIIPLSRYAIVADRYAYVASIGIFFLLAYFLDKVLERRTYPKISIAITFIYILVLGIYANQHSRIWHDSDLLKKEIQDQLEKRNKFQNKTHQDGIK